MVSTGLLSTALNRQASSAPINTTIVVKGLDTIIEDQLAIAEFTYRATRTGVDWAGAFFENLAKEIHRPHIDTGETFNSISRTEEGLHEEGFGNWAVEVGPETLQAYLLEWGFLHVGGQWVQYPFMIPAADLIAPLFTDLFVQIAGVAAFNRQIQGPFAGGVADELDAVRSRLYAFSKLAGDLRVFGFGGPALGKARGFALTGAEIAGDIQSVMRNAIGTRVTRRVVGRFASGSLRAQVSATVTGPPASFQGAATRILNRISGFTVGRGVGGI